MKTHLAILSLAILSIIFSCKKEDDIVVADDTGTTDTTTDSTFTDNSNDVVVIDTTNNTDHVDNDSFQIESDQLTDTRDGQKYKTVKIGSQWWMAENLNYQTPNNSWYYENDSLQYAETYGRLYLYRAIMNNEASSHSNPSGVRGISPEGWHLPSIAEWQQLDDYLSKWDMDAHDLKEIGGANWPSNNPGTNDAGFNLVPAGTIFANGTISANLNVHTTFLSCTEDDETDGVLGVGFHSYSSGFHYAPLGRGNGWSIRCVKD